MMNRLDHGKALMNEGRGLFHPQSGLSCKQAHSGYSADLLGRPIRARHEALYPGTHLSCFHENMAALHRLHKLGHSQCALCELACAIHDFQQVRHEASQ